MMIFGSNKLKLFILIKRRIIENKRKPIQFCKNPGILKRKQNAVWAVGK